MSIPKSLVELLEEAPATLAACSGMEVLLSAKLETRLLAIRTASIERIADALDSLATLMHEKESRR